MSLVRRIGYTLLAVVAVGLALHGISKWYREVPVDLRDFLAGGEVVAIDHADPYRTEPLLHFENVMPTAGERMTVVAPVPVPPYDLLALGWLSRLPIRAAVTLMAAITLGSGLLTYLAIVRYAGLSPPVVIAVTFIPILGFAINVGQIAPISIAALACAAWALRAARPRVAALALLVAAVEPHMAAGAIVAALLLVPRTRLTLAVGIALLALVPVTILGVGSWLEYAQTLPLHAAAEAHFPGQYSLTWLLVAGGMSVTQAVRAGSLSTVALALASIVVLVRSRVAAVESGAVVLLPATAAVLAGTFVHAHQIEIALVPALWYLRPARRPFDASWIVAALIVPFPAALAWSISWPGGAGWITLVLSLIVAWVTVFDMNRGFGDGAASRKATLVVGTLGACFGGFVIAHHHLDLRYGSVDVAGIDPRENASLAWRIFCDAIGATFHQPWFLIPVKTFTWLALSATLVAVSRALLRRAGGRNLSES